MKIITKLASLIYSIKNILQKTSHANKKNHWEKTLERLPIARQAWNEMGIKGAAFGALCERLENSERKKLAEELRWAERTVFDDLIISSKTQHLSNFLDEGPRGLSEEEQLIVRSYAEALEKFQTAYSKQI